MGFFLRYNSGSCQLRVHSQYSTYNLYRCLALFISELQGGNLKFQYELPKKSLVNTSLFYLKLHIVSSNIKKKTIELDFSENYDQCCSSMRNYILQILEKGDKSLEVQVLARDMLQAVRVRQPRLSACGLFDLRMTLVTGFLSLTATTRASIVIEKRIAIINLIRDRILLPKERKLKKLTINGSEPETSFNQIFEFLDFIKCPKGTLHRTKPYNIQM
ncbi:hypothetical protein EVAR_97927_1 [Eumeta japonica]|uniref:Uncharacterized protein n=1 Tax=Eumeta variegata TaxID=151549 RepID=A0A4C1XYA8_EUMVA|nr:hypothetical protein EVAR_97927_1 [Eumeta japonica]